MNIKTTILIILVVILFSFPVLGNNFQRFGLEAHYEHFISDRVGRLLTQVGGRYWWEGGFGIEGNFGMYTHNGGPFPYYSGRFLATLIEGADLKLYVSVGIYDVDYTSYIESLGTMGGHFKGLGVEFRVTDTLNIDLRINHYEAREKAGRIVGPDTHLLTGVGIIYYF